MKQPVEEMVFTAISAFDDPAERGKFLDYACRDDPGLRKRLDELLSIQAEADTFFEFQPEVQPDRAPAEKAQEEGIGAHIGRYRLIRQIGAGGCGVVYRAEQEEPVRRKVALKIVKLGMDTAAVIARFERERQALAQMDHPHIARVFDAGATESGRPYFVMELVDGERITGFCDAHRFDVRQRLDLFAQVCRAIQHAHQKGLIHCDLKPSNVLVHSQEGAPASKIIDFGIAKASAANVTSDTASTQHNQLLGTPAYMSPEQAQGSADVDTRSDIYSLGVLLYELLSGRTPFDVRRFAENSVDEVRRIVREEEPKSPSTALKMAAPEERAFIAAHRGTTPAHLAAQLAGDLDRVVMKAMEKERSRRYESASGLAMDVMRYLNDEVVLARPSGRAYRLGKLVRRNKLIFAAGSIAAFGLLAGFGASTGMFFREREARWEAERARGSETQLRAEADARAKIAQAALLLSRDQIAEADQLLEKVQIPVAEPSLEATAVFRKLGDWNVAHGRWKTAADRFLNLEQANQVDKSNTTVEATRDVLGAGPALILADEVNRYHQFVRSTLARFVGTSDPTAAEQMMKNSLILPVDAAVVRQLEPLARVVENSIANVDPSASKGDIYLPWRSLALALYEYRAGNFAEAVRWGEISHRWPDVSPARTAMIHSVLSMAYARLGQAQNSSSNLAAGRVLIQKYAPNGPEKVTRSGGVDKGAWYDWVIASLLFKEAEQSNAGR